MRRFGGRFDILRIIIAAANDDDVLHAAGDEELSIAKEAQIAGAKELARKLFGQPSGAVLAVFLLLRMGVEDFGVFTVFIPISRGD